jgi:hypothetical protein
MKCLQWECGLIRPQHEAPSRPWRRRSLGGGTAMLSVAAVKMIVCIVLNLVDDSTYRLY